MPKNIIVLTLVYLAMLVSVAIVAGWLFNGIVAPLFAINQIGVSGALAITAVSQVAMIIIVKLTRQKAKNKV